MYATLFVLGFHAVGVAVIVSAGVVPTTVGAVVSGASANGDEPTTAAETSSPTGVPGYVRHVSSCAPTDATLWLTLREGATTIPS